MKKLSLMLLFLLSGVFLLAGNASAIPIVEISGTGGTTFQISDSDGDGIISWIGDFGVFDITMTMGVTKPHDGSASVPMMHLNGAATTNSSGNLTFKFTETDFGPLDSSITGFISSMTGLGGEQSLEVYYDTDNAPFGMGTQIADLDVLNTTSIFTGIPNVNPFSITMIATMNLNNGTGSFDNAVSPVPEPATMMLLGAGLVGLAGWGKRRRRRS